MVLFPSRLKQFITNSKIITKVGKYALDATQNNPEIEGTLAYEIKHIEAEFAEKLNNAMKWKFIGAFDLEANVMKDISIPNTAKEIWVITGAKNGIEEQNDIQIYGGVSAVIPKEKNNRNIPFFKNVYHADGGEVAKDVYIFYIGDILKIRVKEFLSGWDISVRVYYR